MGARLYLHVTWTTLNRLPLISESVRRFLDSFLRTKARQHRTNVLAVGMVSDHVHLVVEVEPVFDLPALMQGLKGASARIANRDGHAEPRPLQWSAGYDARTVGISQLPSVIRYVETQSSHHRDRAIDGGPAV
jgi:putative transposase